MEKKDLSNDKSEIFYTPRNSSGKEPSYKSIEEEIPTANPENILKHKLEQEKDGFDEKSFHDIIVSLLNLSNLSE